MVKIKILLENEQGEQLSNVKSLDLELGNKTIYEIEREVEKFKKKMLPEISKELLIQSQRDFNKEKKKTHQ